MLFFNSCDFFSLNKNDREVMAKFDFQGLEDVKLTGIVYFVNKNIGNGFHGRGIIRVKILSSNVNHYDPRNKQINYYCIIKNKKAEIYCTSASYLNIGDTVNINSNNRV